MKGKICIPFVFLSILLNSGCEQKRYDLKYDLVRQRAAQIHEETQRIDFREAANHQEYLLRGWNYMEEEHTWAQDKSCSVEFYTYDVNNNLEMEFSCRTIPSKSGRIQTVSIFLNEDNVGSFRPDTASFQPVRFTLPASALHPGRNVIEFRSSYTSKPSEIYSGSMDMRDLSIAFQRIEFKQNLGHLDDEGLFQKANSTFSAFASLPVRFKLSVQYRNSPKANSSIVLKSESNERISIILPPFKKKYEKTFHLKNEGIYELRFATEGPPDSYTIWSRIELRTPKESAGNPKRNTNPPHLNKPDILIYVVDTLRADHMSCYGYDRITSPNIDKFAQENILYLNAYANTSWTKASGAAILTGLFPKHNKTMARDDKMPEDIVTLTEILKDAGYFTAAFIGNGNLSHEFGFDQGFDLYEEFFGTYPHSRHVQSNSINKKIFDFFNDFLRRDERKPLFILIWTVDPHDPYAPEDSVKDLFDIRRYTPIDTYDFRFLEDVRDGKIRPSISQIEFMKTRYDQEIFFNDMSFGELLRVMKSQGIYDNSVILFTSDHGEEFFDHGGVGHGWTLYNEQIRIPLIIKVPQAGRGRPEDRVQHIDIYPTILEILKLKPPYELDGISFFRIVNPLRTLYFEEHLGPNDLNAVLDPEKKMIYNRHFHRRPSKELIPIVELYTKDDPHELNNLSFEGFADLLRLQNLFSFRNNVDKFIAERQKTEIPKDLDKKLKALGYIK